MIKTLFALALLSGSLSVFADDYYEDTTATYPEHYKTRTERMPSDSYSDEASSSMSSTTTQDYSNSASMNADTTVTGTMGPGESLGERYNKLHVGLLGGVNTPAGSDVKSSAEYGVDVGFQPTSIFSVGVEGTTTKLDRADEARRSMALLKLSTRFGGDIPFIKDFFVGAGAGSVITDGNWRFGGGPLAGFDIPLTANRSHDYISLGANAKYIWTNNSPDSLISAVALKYWF